MEDANKAKLAQEATLRDESLAMRVATEVARALNLSVRTTPTWLLCLVPPFSLMMNGSTMSM